MWSTYRVLASFALLVMLSTSVAALTTPYPYDPKQFSKDFSLDPMYAVKRAVSTNNDFLVWSLDFTKVDPLVSEQILDVALSESMPPNKIADAISAGAILKVNTWKRLSETQLSAPVPGGGHIRDKTPDLSQLNNQNLAYSIQADAGINRDDRLSLRPGAVSTSLSTDHGVTVTSIEAITWDSETFQLSGTEHSLSTLFGETYGALSAETLTINKPSPHLATRETIYPEVGRPSVDRRFIIITNATGVSFDPHGMLTIDSAARVELYVEPDITSQRKNTSEGGSFGPGSKAPSAEGRTADLIVSNGRDVHINTARLLTGTNTSGRELLGHDLSIHKAAQVTFLESTSRDIQDFEADFGTGTARVTSADVIITGPLHLSEASRVTFRLDNRASFTMPNNTAVNVVIDRTSLPYHTTSPMNILSTSLAPINGQPGFTFSIHGGTLTFPATNGVHVIEAGNTTLIETDNERGFSCADFTPLGSYSYRPSLLERSFSLVTFSIPHRVCVTSPSGEQPVNPCTTHCTLIEPVKKTLTNHGIVDYQRYLGSTTTGTMRGILTPYTDTTTVLTLDSDMNQIAHLSIIDGTLTTIRPSAYLNVVDHTGRRFITIDDAVTDAGVPLVRKIDHDGILPMTLTTSYAVQQTQTDRNIYILYPKNPQITELVRQADARLAPYLT